MEAVIPEEKKCFTYKAYQINYWQFGKGEKFVFCFHGFGQTGYILKSLYPKFGKEFTLVCPDLFFHGESVFPEEIIDDKPLSNLEFAEVISAFFENVQPKEKHIVLGFSLGGRYVINQLSFFSETIEKVYLLAADGLKNYWWKEVGTTLLLTKWLFKKCVQFPIISFLTLKLLRLFFLIPKSIEVFAKKNMRTEEQRRRVYNNWMALRFINTDFGKLKLGIQKHRIPVYLYFGEKDRVIPAKQGRRFAKHIACSNLIKITVLKGGHSVYRSDKLNF